MSEYLIKEDVDNILKEYASKAWNDDWKPTHETVRGDTFIEACLIIDDMPTADVQPVKRGQWIWDSAPELGNPYGSYRCSECGNRMKFQEIYCCGCGARMEEKGENETD